MSFVIIVYFQYPDNCFIINISVPNPANHNMHPGRCHMLVQVVGWPRQCRPGSNIDVAGCLTFLQRFDAKTMVDNPKVSASTGMVDDGTGVKEVNTLRHLNL